MDPREWVTMREAASILASTGVGRETTRRLVYAGLAGEVVRRGNGTMVQRDSVVALARRPWIPEPAGSDRCGSDRRDSGRRDSLVPDDWRPTFVARLRTWPVVVAEERAEAIRGPWRISALGRVRLRADVDRHGFVPLVATVGGFVVLGAEIVAVTPHGGTGCWCQWPSRGPHWWPTESPHPSWVLSCS